MNQSLKTRLLAYLRNRHTRVASGDLQRLVIETTNYTPSNVSRRLRELENEGLIQVDYIKGHAWYMACPPKVVEPIYVGGVKVSERVTWN